MRRAVLWSCWLIPSLALPFFIIREAGSVQVTPNGLEFLNISEQVFVYTALLAWTIIGPIVACPRKLRVIGGFACLAITLGSGWLVQGRVMRIAYDRTPACWGIHSQDWGSGYGCPPGMRDDFTLEQIREYDSARGKKHQ
ncbi:MAG TPA: hypothetical protein VHE55_12595 [Fimbriimonadaceae bacterium]|nr:hypothetical protein [Fimbriimonadaceae bacterium]